ncbi:UvrD-helicase domain-containing protein [Nafulsella turpanensis]|uniref:UvrD-helicase domain-containing protein n=1 Tax=Nafulsella turpanensis TaxID=1265690 RepID=UPI0003472786|nr:UvrD-helicase domain-containing protein [Nafulsella turpanensis]
MPIKVIKINGEHPKLDYKKLEDSFRQNFGRTCSEATIIIMNNFPVMVTSETDIDFIVIIAIEDKDGNYISFYKNDRRVYLHNLIIPVIYNSDYKDLLAQVEGNNLLIDNNEVDFSKEVTSLTFNLKHYLNNRCGFDAEAYIHPLVFIESHSSIVLNDYIVGRYFDFTGISNWLKNSDKEILISFKGWKDPLGYQDIQKDLARVAEQASRDSATGYLTKKKIERIGKELSKQTDLSQHMAKKMVMVRGKAGSGKTTNLLTLNLQALKQGFNTFFLTYNRVLVYDIAQVIKPILNSEPIEKQASVDTLHSFFYQLSKSLGVLHIMSDKRINGVLSILKNRLRQVYNFVAPRIILNNKTDFEKIKSLLQNEVAFDNGTKEVGIDFINFLSKKRISSKNALINYSREFYNWKEKRLTSIATDEVFLADYYGVLENTLLQIKDSDKFYEQFDIQNKGELLDLATGAGKVYFNEKGVIEKKEFAKFKNRRVGGRKKNRIVFIDEAQDCHRLEKEILATIFGTSRLVIANGGKDQLIRHVELCNWQMIRGQKIESFEKNKRNKSYRIKPQIADFCNFYSKAYNINLDLESLDTPDSGEIIFDFRPNPPLNEVCELFDYLKSKAEVNGCLEYESILVLLESLQNGPGENKTVEQAAVNEYNNIEVTQKYTRGEWSKLKGLEEHGYHFFNATVLDKTKLGLPYPNQIRIIFYESCRGLEAWSVACFDIDQFFEAKCKEEEAEKFLLETEKGSNVQNLFITNEERKKMYAATWVLMALTRVIDTLYINVSNQNSEFAKIVNQYIQRTNKNIKVLK